MKSDITYLRVPGPAREDDRRFFNEHADRNFRIREPYEGEYTAEFQSLGPQDSRRRRVICARIPRWQQRHYNVDMMRIPFLLFADETVEDRDDILRPIFDEIMRDARQKYETGH